MNTINILIVDDLIFILHVKVISVFPFNIAVLILNVKLLVSVLKFTCVINQIILNL